MSLRTLVNRMTMGFSQSEMSLARTKGAAGYIDYHMNYTAIDDSAVESKVTSLYPMSKMSAWDIYSLGDQQFYAPYHTQGSRFLRALESPRQLLERMSEFWSDHFSIYLYDDGAYICKHLDDRDVTREHAFGTFRQMLEASAKSPAMLLYLDNYVNYPWAPQENYARELMELHTLGVDGGYTQDDVREVARCFTGWTINFIEGQEWFTFIFYDWLHDTGEKKVLGHTIPAGRGIEDGLQVLDILAAHPKTARFVSKKMLNWFWGPGAPDDIVTMVTQTYMSTGGNIAAMVRLILNLVATRTPPAKYQRPMGQVLTALRSVPHTITQWDYLPYYLGLPQMGQMPFEWVTPDGYPDTYQHWVSLLLPRWNFGARLVSDRLYGAAVNWNEALAGTVTAAQIADRIDYLMFDGEMPASDKARIQSYMTPPESPTTRSRHEAVGLAIGAQGTQWY